MNVKVNVNGGGARNLELGGKNRGMVESGRREGLVNVKVNVNEDIRIKIK